MSKIVLIKDFWPHAIDESHDVFVEDLGWSEYVRKMDAMSDDPETIFRYYEEIVGINIVFYWTVNHQFYSIFNETYPIEVRKIYLNPEWDGKYEFQRFESNYGPHSHSDGEVIATFDDPSKIWDGLKIDGVPIGEVLEKSIITDLN